VATAFVTGAGTDADLVHTAGVIHPDRVADFYRVNTQGTANVATAARAAGIRRLVHVSSNSPFGTNPHPHDRFRQDEPYHPYLGYGRSKMEAELAVLAAVHLGLDATIVRPPWFYGPYQPPRQTTFFRMVRTGRFPVIGGGRQQRSMVYVDNLVDGLLAAELAPHARGKGYWVADARPYEVREIVDTVQRALADEGLDVQPGALRLPALAGRVAETADRVIQRAGRYQQQLHVLGEMGHTIACDISATRAELGYDPKVELYDGMRASIRWCLGQGLSL
jgi:nucleoside-diphosphate-sugar epimerase